VPALRGLADSSLVLPRRLDIVIADWR